jgi:hypothetical protein
MRLSRRVFPVAGLGIRTARFRGLLRPLGMTDFFGLPEKAPAPVFLKPLAGACGFSRGTL